MKYFLICCVAILFFVSCGDAGTSAGNTQTPATTVKNVATENSDSVSMSAPVRPNSATTDGTESIPDTLAAGAPLKTEAQKSYTLSGGQNRWSAYTEKNFMAQCISTASHKVGEGKASAYCACMLQKIELAFPSVTAFEKNYTTAQLTQWATECNR